MTAKATITRRYDAAPSGVFAACTRPELLARWLGPHTFEVFEVETDLRVGGRFAFRMKNQDGVLGVQGAYQEIVPDRRLVFSWQWFEDTADNAADEEVSRLIIDLAPDRDGAMLTLTHEGLPDQKQADGHTRGWSQSLDKLENLMATSF